jgi:hypothetical protein
LQEHERREREELLSTDRIQAIDATAISIDDAELDHHSRLQRATGGEVVADSESAGARDGSELRPLNFLSRPFFFQAWTTC